MVKDIFLIQSGETIEPLKIGDRVECDVRGTKMCGVIFNDQTWTSNQGVAVILDEKTKLNTAFLQGYGVTFGNEVLSDPNKIRKIGSLTEEEMKAVFDRVNKLSLKK